MKRTIPLTHARAELDVLIGWALAGDEVVITRRGKPVARLEPIPEPRRQMGTLAGTLVISDEFFDPLPQEELEAWGQ